MINDIDLITASPGMTEIKSPTPLLPTTQTTPHNTYQAEKNTPVNNTGVWVLTLLCY